MTHTVQWRLYAPNNYLYRHNSPGDAFWAGYAPDANIIFNQNALGIPDEFGFNNIPALLAGQSYRLSLLSDPLHLNSEIAGKDFGPADHPVNGPLLISLNDNDPIFSGFWANLTLRDGPMSKSNIFTIQIPFSRGNGGNREAYIDMTKRTFYDFGGLVYLNFAPGGLTLSSTFGDVKLAVFNYNPVMQTLEPIDPTTGNIVPGPDLPANVRINGSIGGAAAPVTTFIVHNGGAQPNRNLVFKLTAPDGSVAWFGTRGISTATGVADSDNFAPLPLVFNTDVNNTWLDFSNIVYAHNTTNPYGSFNALGSLAVNPSYQFRIFESITPLTLTDSLSSIIDLNANENLVLTSPNIQFQNYDGASATWAYRNFDLNNLFGAIPDFPAADLDLVQTAGDNDYLQINFPAGRRYRTEITTNTGGVLIRGPMSGSQQIQIYQNDILGGYFPGADAISNINVKIFDEFGRVLPSHNGTIFNLDMNPPQILFGPELRSPIGTPITELKLGFLDEKDICYVYTEATDNQTDDTGIADVFFEMRKVGDTAWPLKIRIEPGTAPQFRHSFNTLDFFGMVGAVEWQTRAIDRAGRETLSAINTLDILPTDVTNFKLKGVDYPFFIFGEPIIFDGVFIPGLHEVTMKVSVAGITLYEKSFGPFENWGEFAYDGPPLPGGIYNFEVSTPTAKQDFSIVVFDPFNESKKKKKNLWNCFGLFAYNAEPGRNNFSNIAQNDLSTLNYLRHQVRDNFLNNFSLGRSFIHWYYEDLPQSAFAQWLLEKEERREIVRNIINAAVDLDRTYNITDKLNEIIQISEENVLYPEVLSFFRNSDFLNREINIAVIQDNNS